MSFMRQMSLYQFILMKKVRKRVVQRQNQETNEDTTAPQLQAFLSFGTNKTEQIVASTQQHQQNNQQREAQRVTHGKKSEILIPTSQTQPETKQKTSSIKNKAREEASIIPVTQIKATSQSPKITQSYASDSNKQSEPKGEEDDRKNRIELLKQKYLKKSPEVKIQMTKNMQVSNIPITETPKIQERSQKIENIKQIVEQKHKEHIYYQQKVQINTSQSVKIVARSNQTQDFAQLKQNTLKEATQAKQYKQAQKIPNNNILQKADEKKVFKVPPPPTKGVRSKPPPPPVARNQIAQQQAFLVKQHPQQKKLEAPIQVSDGCPEQEKQAVRPTFVPPPPPVFKSNKVPPPPKSLLVQDILAKKAKKQQAKVVNQEQTINENVVQVPVQNTIKYQQLKPTEQTIEIKQSHTASIPNKESLSTQQQTSFSQQIHNWINYPSKNLSNIINNLDEIIHTSGDSNEKDFTFTSSDKGFNSSISGFINEFILKNKSGLSQGQKSATYALSIEYFNGNVNHLSTQLLLILVKIGEPYLSKHISLILNNLSQNIRKLISNKAHYNNGELSTFFDIILDQDTINQGQLLHLLMLSSTEKLINTISSKNINNVLQIIQLLSCIQLIRKENPSIINLYLKFINTLIQNIPDDQTIIESILKHLNQLQTNQKSYQLHKQIKLKLISLLSNSQKPTKQQARASVPEPSKESGDGGLLGYWNKAVDKIKTATTQFAQLKPEKSKPVQQQQQKEEEITYDPVLKRYLINGKVPEDDSSRPSDPTASKLPPPPPSKNTNPSRPVPPPLPGKKTRVPTNRYA